MKDEKFHLDDSLVRLLLKKKRQSVKRFYRSGSLDTENITAAFTSKNIFTRTSGDNRRGTCHILLDCSGSTRESIGKVDGLEIQRIKIMAACAMQMARYLSRFFKVKMSLFKEAPLKPFDIPKKFLPEQFAQLLYNSMRDPERMSVLLGGDHNNELKNFAWEDGNDAPGAIKKSIDLLSANNSKSLIVAICDGDPYATGYKNNIDKMKEFQKKHAVVFSVIDDIHHEDGKCSCGDPDCKAGGGGLREVAEDFEKKHGIRTALTSDKDAIRTGGGMVINNTLLKIHESFK